MRSSAQSPPPMTLPARTLAILTGWLLKNERRKELMAISAVALLAL